jgi:hypothetical protein
MIPQTRIGFGSLVNTSGSVVLPTSVTLECPQCKTPVADKGQCLANFEMVPNPEASDQMCLRVLVDCRNCGCMMKEPNVKNEF